MNIKSKLQSYFTASEFQPLLEELKRKYSHYGSCVGTISVNPKNCDEAIKLSKFLSKNIKENRKINIKIKDIQKSLDDSIFEGTTVDDLVLLLFPNIKSNRQIKMEKESYIDGLLTKYKELYRDSFIYYLFDHIEALKKIKYCILHDQDLLDTIFKSLIQLPCYQGNQEYLSIFATLSTGDPHYYDIDTHNSNLLLQFICYLFDLKYENNRSMKKYIFEQAGILVDEVSNYVITYNLSGNEMLDVFKRNLTPLVINLSNIQKMPTIKTENNILLVVENPSFISRVNHRNIHYSVIITSGNSNLVVYKLLEKIHNTKIYFNGDFDPEGLLIAQHFKNQYANVQFIGYNEKYYFNGLSDNHINESRLKKLNSILDSDLNVIKELLIQNRRASYQEGNYDMLLDEIEKIVIYDC